VNVAERRGDARGVWLSRIKHKQRGGANLAAVALANKNARVLWALLTRKERYRPATLVAGAQVATSVRLQPDNAVAPRAARKGAPAQPSRHALARLCPAQSESANTAPAPSSKVRNRRGGGKR